MKPKKNCDVVQSAGSGAVLVTEQSTIVRERSVLQELRSVLSTART